MKKSLLVASLAVITANVLGMNNLQQQSNKSNNKRLVTVSDSQLNDSKESTNQIMDPHNKRLSEVPAKEPEDCESELDELAKYKMVTKESKYMVRNIIEKTILENFDKERLDLIKKSMDGLDKDSIAEIINENGGSLIFSALGNYHHIDIVLFLLEQEGVNVNVKKHKKISVLQQKNSGHMC